MKDENDGLIKLAGLWKRKGKKGEFYSGRLSYSAQILLFKNQYKRDEKDPDLILYLARLSHRDKSEEIGLVKPL